MGTTIDNKLLWERFTEENEELIVTAVNACKTINPDNPLSVAKMIPKIFEKCYELRDMIAVDSVRATLRTSAEFIREMDLLFTEALKQATE